MGAPAPFADLGVDRPRDVVPRRQLGRPPRVGLLALGQGGHPAGRLLVRGGVLRPPVLGQVVPHEPFAVLVAQDPALAADRLGDEQPANARRPDHPGRVELDELHVDQLGAGLIGEGLAVAAVLPGVGRDLVGLADPAGRQHDRLGREHDRLPGRAPVAERAGDPGRPRDQARDRALHVDLDAERDRPVLEGADHLEAGPVADVRQPRVRMATERSLQDPAVRGPVEDGAPQLELADARRRLRRVELGHPRVVQELAADHRVAEVDLPGVGGGHVLERGRDSALGHDRVRLAEEGLADEPDVRAGHLRLDRGSQAGPAGTDHEHVVRADLGLRLRGRREGHRSTRRGSPGRRSHRWQAAARRCRRT